MSKDPDNSDDVGVIADLKGCVRGADFRYAFDVGVTYRVAHRKGFKKSIKRHFVIYFDIDVFVATVGIACLHDLPPVIKGLVLDCRRPAKARATAYESRPHAQMRRGPMPDEAVLLS